MPDSLALELNMRQPEWTGSGTKQLPGAVTGGTAGLIQVVHEGDVIRMRCSAEAVSGQFDGLISIPLLAA